MRALDVAAPKENVKIFLHGEEEGSGPSEAEVIKNGAYEREALKLENAKRRATVAYENTMRLVSETEARKDAGGYNARVITRPGWGAKIKPQAFSVFTAAGLLGLAVGYGLDTERKRAGDMGSDETLQKGLDRLAQGIGTPGEFGDRPRAVETYFLWSVERVGVLYHLAKISGKDWYRWGLEILDGHQREDGHWYLARGPGSSDLVDTCFALLFLKQANLAQDLTDKIQAMAAMRSDKVTR